MVLFDEQTIKKLKDDVRNSFIISINDLLDRLKDVKIPSDINHIAIVSGQ